jgi:pilus assembly protein CpaF
VQYQIEISRNNVPIHWLALADGTFVIGRHPSCDILLDSTDVPPEQARIDKSGDRVLLFNLGNGPDVRVNGREVRSTILHVSDSVEIRNFALVLKEGEEGAFTDVSALKKMIHQRLVERLDLKKIQAEKLGDRELWQRCDLIVGNIIEGLQPLPAGIDPAALKKDILNEALALGPLEGLLADDTVTEIMVNGRDKVFVERKGKLTRTPLSFTSDEQVVNIISRIVSPLGRRIDESVPMVDARLKDGSRVNAIIPPLSLRGPTITIRKFAEKMFTVDDLISFGSMTREMATFLSVCVEMRKNMVISGGTGSGKTSLLNVLSAFIPSGERVITIEDSAELRLPHEDLCGLEARPPNIEGKGEVTIRDLVRNALRMRPDRIIVGECRGGEAIDMLQAMNTGHDGSLTTIHANNTRDAILRLETMVMMSGFDLPVVVIRRQIAAAIHVIVQQARMRDGSRKIIGISEVTGLTGDIVNMTDLFVYKQTGLGQGGEVQGQFVATGHVPTFMGEAADWDVRLPKDIFNEGRILK